MGAVTSLWKKETVEQVLEKLERKITTLEYRQRTSYVSRRKVTAALIFYSFFIEAGIVGWFYFHNKPADLMSKLKHASPLLLFPFLVFFLKYVIAFYYSRRIISDEAELLKLRGMLKTKLDERKKATDFDHTQKLLSKYEKLAESKDVDRDTPPPPPSKPSSSPPKKNAEAQSSKVHSPQSSSQSNLRQRNVQPQGEKEKEKDKDKEEKREKGKEREKERVRQPQEELRNAAPDPAAQQSSGWVNRLVDYLVGTGPQYGFALICSKCSAHNGLAPPSEMGAIQFRCRTCNHLNEYSPQPKQQQQQQQPQPQQPVTRTKTRSHSDPIELPNAQTTQQAQQTQAQQTQAQQPRQPQQSQPQQHQPHQHQPHGSKSPRALGKSQSFSNSPQLPRNTEKSVGS